MAVIPSDRGFWSDLLRRVAFHTRGQNDAEDLLHAAYLRLARYSAEHEVENPAAFLVRTAVNISVDEHRHASLMRNTGQIGDFDIQSDAPLQDEVLASRARLERVKAGLLQLTPRTREVFLMHRLEGLKYREIAARLGISESAVEKHIGKAALFLAEWTEGW
jgi:RNA polymerase sigma-70 factor (ECF subfamily)